MIRFSTACLMRSMRWVAPFLVLITWATIALRGNGPALVKASTIFPAVLIWSTWITIATGNHDDDAHRDLVAAAAGGPARVHILRAIAAAAVSFAPIVVIAVLVLVSVSQLQHSAAVTAIAIIGFETSALAVGVAIGVWLHRPILRHRAVATLTAVAACTAVMISPPVLEVHRAVNDNRLGLISPLLAASVVVAALSIATAAQIARHRS